MHTVINMSSKEMALQFALDKLSTSDMFEIADERLNEGVYSETLNDIYMEGTGYGTCHTPGITALFEMYLCELGVRIPKRSEAILTFLKNTLLDIINNKVDLEEGCNYLYTHIYKEYEGELVLDKIVGSSMGLEYIFCWLRELWDCDMDGSLSYYSHLSKLGARSKILYHLEKECERWFELNIQSFELSNEPRPTSITRGFSHARFTKDEKIGLYP